MNGHKGPNQSAPDNPPSGGSSTYPLGYRAHQRDLERRLILENQVAIMQAIKRVTPDLDYHIARTGAYLEKSR